MKKIFSFFAAMLATVALNAAVINISHNTPDALRLALNDANDGDVIVMQEGLYVESNGNYIAFAGKDVTVKADEGANVVIQPQVPVTVKEGGCAHFENVKFDVSRLTELATWYEHLIYAEDAAANNRIVLEGCEIYNFNLNKSLLYCSASNKLAAVTINNCYIHNTMKSVLFVENTTDAINVQVTNSTFANIETNTASYWAGIIDLRNAAAQLLVDHCTFYNVIPMNTDYSCVSKITLANGVTSNCIFMLPTAQDGIRAMRGVAATNCITFNYLKDSGTGIHSSVTQTNCVQADPLFVDAANGNFALGDGSPALTMNDGQPIGDPRWNASAPVVETEYFLTGTFNNWAVGDVNYKFAANPEAEGEYMLMGVALEANAGIKVVDNAGTYYPEGMGNEKVVAEAGTYDIYFRPDGQGNSDWHYGYFYVAAQAAEPVAVAKNFEIDMQTAVFGGAMAQYLYIDGENQYNYSADAPAEYNAYFEAQGFTADHGYHQLIVTVPVEAGNYRVMLGKCQYAYSADYTMAYVKTLDGQVLGSGKQNTTSAEEGGVCYHQDTEHNKVRIDFVSTEAQMVKIYCAHYTPYIKFEKIEDTTGLQNTAVDGKVVKTIENGQLVIIKNGVRYNAVGAQL